MAEESQTKTKKASTTSYRFVGSHADTTAAGAPIGPGDQVDLTDEEAKEPHNAMLLETGAIIPIEEGKE